MKKGEEISILIEDSSFPNKGIGKFQDTKVVVKNALLGQRVLCRIQKKRNGTAEGRLLEVLEKSPMQSKKGCSHYEVCGGCLYQSFEDRQELQIKQKQVLQLFEDAGISSLSYEGIVSANEAFYRNKCEFSFGDEQKGGSLALGMRKRQSFYEVVTLKDCNIVEQDFLTLLQAALQFFQARNIPFYHKMKHDGQLRHLVIRKGYYTGEILVNLVTASAVSFSVEEWAEELLKVPLNGRICGILHTENDSVADVVKPEKVRLLYGRDYYHDSLFQLSFQISAFSFFQTNTVGAELLYSIVKEYVGDAKDKVIFDLYCGTGTIAQILASEAKSIYGIEIVEDAVEAAKENAKRNQITNCTFLAGDVLKLVDTLPERPDIIVVDPPRDGIHPKAIEKIIAFDAQQVIYVSCKPTSLVRDLKIWIEAGYQILKWKLADQFHRTANVETVVKLQKEEKEARNKQ